MWLFWGIGETGGSFLYWGGVLFGGIFISHLGDFHVKDFSKVQLFTYLKAENVVWRSFAQASDQNKGNLKLFVTGTYLSKLLWRISRNWGLPSTSGWPVLTFILEVQGNAVFSFLRPTSTHSCSNPFPLFSPLRTRIPYHCQLSLLQILSSVCQLIFFWPTFPAYTCNTIKTIPFIQFWTAWSTDTSNRRVFFPTIR